MDTCPRADMSSSKTLSCTNCGSDFLFTAAEQDFFAQKGLTHEPKRCPDCRLELRNWRKSKSGEPTAPLALVVCDNCGSLTKVPFQPKGHRPVYCLLCLHAKNTPGSEPNLH